MDIFTVSLFGHREIDDLLDMEKRLAPFVKYLLRTKNYVSFIIGRNGEFDEYAASVVKRVRKEVGAENSEINLILPYEVADLAYYENYYDGILIPESLQGVHHKFVITARNRWMIEQSDIVLVYVNREYGGAYAAMKYAQKSDKEVVNLCEREAIEFYELI